MSTPIQLIQEVGRATASSLYPNEIEYYLCAFELVNSVGQTTDYFVFPVMPQSISRREKKIKEIRKTAGGITVTKTATFVPIDFQLSGTFGRSLKVLLGRSALQIGFGILQSIPVSGMLAKRAIGQVQSSLGPLLSSSIKTGYGATKVLQNILDRADGLDELDKPYILNFYNLAFGEGYVVECESHSFTIDESQSNQIWRYQISLTAVAPLQIKANNIRALINNNVFQYKINSAPTSIFNKTFRDLI